MKRKAVRAALVAAVCIAAGMAGMVAAPAQAAKNEVMTDRCSNEVAFVPKYDDLPSAKDTVILKREADGSTKWTPDFSVATDDDGHIRWWCRSTTGDEFDVGTWRVSFNAAGLAPCLVAIGGTIGSSGAGAAGLAACAKTVNIGSSAWKGWTPEQSRCSDHSKRIRARLGPDRLLQTECLD